MSTILYLQMNFISIMLLGIMYVYVTPVHAAKSTIDQYLFKLLIGSVIAVFIFDSGMWIFNGKTFTYAKEMNYITTTMYLALNPVTCFFWLLYGKYKLSAETRFNFKNILLYSIPVIINTFFVFISIKTGWLFSIDDMNVYHRGYLMFFTAIFPFSYFFIMSFIVIKQWYKRRNAISKEMYLYFFLFPIPPMVGAIIQLLYYGVSLIWTGMLISIFLIFINVQNRQIFNDSLTGLYNRRFLENQLKNPLSSNQSGDYLYALMIDVDNFKKINDVYGHLSGDFALIKTANVLQAACSREDFIIRYGGDEFFILGYCSDIEQVYKKIDAIESAMMESNEQRDLPFSISLSIGHAVYTKDKYETLAALMKKADESMYSVKNMKKMGMKNDSYHEVHPNC